MKYTQDILSMTIMEKVGQIFASLQLFIEEFHNYVVSFDTLTCIISGVSKGEDRRFAQPPSFLQHSPRDFSKVAMKFFNKGVPPLLREFEECGTKN